MTTSSSTVDIGIHKVGLNGRPRINVMIDSDVSFEKLSVRLQTDVTRNTELRKKLGLKACLACTSGMDLDIRHRFDEVMRIDLNKLGQLGQLGHG
jgi:hypothetical protein